MKRQWTPDELAEHWTLTSRDGELIANKTGATRLGFALLLKFFQHDGRFPHHKGDVPTTAVVYVAQQLGLPPELYAQYAWTGRTLAYHRLQIRQALDFRESTEQDIEELTVWLREDVLPHDHRPDRAQEAVYARCRAAHLEPPAPKRVERLVRSALRTYEDQVHQQVLEQLGPTGLAQIDGLLATTPEGEVETADAAPADPRDPGRLSLRDLKADPGRVSLESVLTQIARLRRVRQVALPETVFAGVAPHLVQAYRQRAAAEPPSELRAHAEAVRATLVAALCLLRRQEITDGLIDLLLATVHKIGARAERRVNQDLLVDIKRVSGKNTLLYHLAEAAVDHPDGVVREVLYPVVGEKTLQDLVREYKASGPGYDLQVQTRLRASYGAHYRGCSLSCWMCWSSARTMRPIVRSSVRSICSSATWRAPSTSSRQQTTCRSPEWCRRIGLRRWCIPIAKAGSALTASTMRSVCWRRCARSCGARRSGSSAPTATAIPTTIYQPTLTRNALPTMRPCTSRKTLMASR